MRDRLERAFDKWLDFYKLPREDHAFKQVRQIIMFVTASGDQIEQAMALGEAYGRAQVISLNYYQARIQAHEALVRAERSKAKNAQERLEQARDNLQRCDMVYTEHCKVKRYLEEVTK